MCQEGPPLNARPSAARCRRQRIFISSRWWCCPLTAGHFITRTPAGAVTTPFDEKPRVRSVDGWGCCGHLLIHANGQRWRLRCALHLVCMLMAVSAANTSTRSLQKQVPTGQPAPGCADSNKEDIGAASPLIIRLRSTVQQQRRIRRAESGKTFCSNVVHQFGKETRPSD